MRRRRKSRPYSDSGGSILPLLRDFDDRYRIAIWIEDRRLAACVADFLDLLDGDSPPFNLSDGPVKVAHRHRYQGPARPLWIGDDVHLGGFTYPPHDLGPVDRDIAGSPK